mmetsp:Transcript_25717/g.64751  ORF Transcript_25717/g.64751 Transcript_25717/m.64751 type:complete len:265 (-) Transcript_25717:2971-3765(-)
METKRAPFCRNTIGMLRWQQTPSLPTKTRSQVAEEGVVGRVLAKVAVVAVPTPLEAVCSKREDVTLMCSMAEAFRAGAIHMRMRLPVLLVHPCMEVQVGGVTIMVSMPEVETKAFKATVDTTKVVVLLLQVQVTIRVAQVAMVTVKVVLQPGEGTIRTPLRTITIKMVLLLYGESTTKEVVLLDMCTVQTVRWQMGSCKESHRPSTSLADTVVRWEGRAQIWERLDNARWRQRLPTAKSMRTRKWQPPLLSSCDRKGFQSAFRI